MLRWYVCIFSHPFCIIMKQLILLVITLLSGSIQAQVPYSFSASWSFEGDNTAGTINVSSATAQNAVFGSGLINFSFPAGNGGGKSYEGSKEWTMSGTRDDNDYIQVCVNTNVGTSFVSGATVTLNFEDKKNQQGPTSFEVRASANNFTSSTSLATGPISGNNWNTRGPFNYVVPAATSTVCFRIYGYSAENDNASSWAFDNIVVAGTNALPVTLTKFNISQSGTESYLSWETELEKNNDYFSIERSFNSRDFSEIGQVKGAGTSYEPQDYAFTDARPLQGKNYYRLRQVDFDGRFSFSPVITATFGKAHQMTLAPLPATETLNIQFQTPSNEGGSWQVFDMSGRRLLSGEILAETVEQPVNIAKLPVGAYVLRLTVGQEVMVEQFRKN